MLPQVGSMRGELQSLSLKQKQFMELEVSVQSVERFGVPTRSAGGFGQSPSHTFAVVFTGIVATIVIGVDISTVHEILVRVCFVVGPFDEGFVCDGGYLERAGQRGQDHRTDEDERQRTLKTSVSERWKVEKTSLLTSELHDDDQSLLRR